MKKNAKNALTSHYANGHGDPCDKWVKNQLAASTANQVHFLGGLAIFHTPPHLTWNGKLQNHPKSAPDWLWKRLIDFLPTCHKGLHDHLRSVMSMHFWRFFHFFEIFCMFWVNWTIERSPVLKK